MKALGFRDHGDLEQLQVLDLPTPEPAPGEALVRVEAAALNRLDLFVLKGWPGLDLPKPHVGGADMAGVVEDVGEGVDGLAPGDAVTLYPSLSCGHCEYCAAGEVSLCPRHRLVGEHQSGTFAEYVTLPAANLRPRPGDYPAEKAAAAALTFVTAWRMLITRGGLRAGESVLVVGSGGGVNTAAIQIANLAGARVTAIAGGPEKAKRALDLGAHEAIDYTADGDWHKTVYKQTGKRGVDLVVDNVGEATFAKSVRAVARGGRIVVVGGTTGYNPTLPLNQLFWKQFDVRGSTMGTPGEFDDVMGLAYAGELEPVIDEVFPLEEGRAAYERLREGEGFGKVVVKP